MALTKISTGGVKDDAASQAKIADEAVDEARLQVSNAGTNGQFLSKQSGNTGGLTWAAANEYTHPNHSGEVTSTGDGATVIADNIVDEANLKVSNTPTNGQFLSAQSGNTGGLTWANVTIPPAGNTISLVADGAIAAGKPVIIKSNGKAEQIGTSSTALTTTSSVGYTHGYTSSGTSIVAEHARIAYDNDNDCYVVVYDTTGGDLVYQTGTIQTNNVINWSSKTTIQSNVNFNNLSLCYAGNSRFVLVYRNGNDSKSYVRIGKVSSGPAITWSSTNYVDGLNGSIYNDPRTVKIANDRVAIICRRGGSDGKWTDGRVGVIIGDVTSDTAWTYRSHLELSSHEGNSDFLSVAYNSTDDVTLAVWKKSNNIGYCRAFKVASGTSATITSSSETTFENDNNIRQHKTAWHSGQNKFITTFGRGGYDDIRSKITTVTISGASISVSVGSAIDLSGTHTSMEINHGMILACTDKGAVWCLWIASGGGGETANRLYGITDDNFNGSTLDWSSKNTMAGAYDPYFDGIHGFFNAEHNNRIVFFGENYNAQPTYFALETETVTSNLTDANRYVGFADQAYSDGQTATINTYGNTVDTLSGLTTGSIYYVQGDGTIGTSWDSSGLASFASNTPLAGTALSATKLLIRDPLAKT